MFIFLNATQNIKNHGNILFYFFLLLLEVNEFIASTKRETFFSYIINPDSFLAKPVNNLFAVFGHEL